MSSSGLQYRHQRSVYVRFSNFEIPLFPDHTSHRHQDDDHQLFVVSVIYSDVPVCVIIQLKVIARHDHVR